MTANRKEYDRRRSGDHGGHKGGAGNCKQGRDRAETMREGNVKRKGGAGVRGGARVVEASYVEEELMRDIGVP
eukprot:2081721-Pleurochrysis_carterae.AAC.1